jgi:hypothetical protein
LSEAWFQFSNQLFVVISWLGAKAPTILPSLNLSFNVYVWRVDRNNLPQGNAHRALYPTPMNNEIQMPQIDNYR